jgi:colicin import membrane protein
MTLAAAYAHEDLLPRPPGGNGAGVLLALAVHAGLLVALTVSVDWRAHPSEVVSAELWASVPQAAAPPPPPAVAAPAPTPPVALPPAPAAPAPEVRPPEPDIATERAERRKAAELLKKQADAEAERQRASAEKLKERQKAEAEQDAQREARAADQRLARQREENLKRMMGQAGSAIDATTTGTAAQDAAPSAAYQSRLAELIRGNSVYTGNSPDNAPAVVEVRAGPSGTIIARRLIKSSGVPEWDDAVLRAIDKTATLPRDADGRVPPLLTIAFRPKR